MTSKELSFTDECVFQKVMKDEKICKGVVETILGKKIAKLEYLTDPEELVFFPEQRHIKLEVLFEGTDKTVNVELKNINKTFGDYKASDNVNFEIEKGKLIGLLGPSGSGKGTIIQEFLKEHKEAWLSVSYTSRAPRTNDVPGETYNFITKEEFEKKIEAGNLLEYAEYNGDYYGTEDST